MAPGKLLLCMLAVSLFATGVRAQKAESREASLEPTLKSIYAGQHRLHEFKTDKTKAVVLAFLDTECPIARKYIPRLSDIHGRLEKEGVRVLGIYANSRV